MARTSSLRVYVPLDAFIDQEREYWEKYTEFQQKWWGGTVFTRFWFWVPDEDFARYKEELSKLLDRPFERITDGYFFRGKDGVYYISPHKRGYLKGGEVDSFYLVGEDKVPVEWFLLFGDDERRVLRILGQGNISYTTQLNKAQQRLERALRVVEELGGEPEQRVVDFWNYYLNRWGRNLKNRSIIVQRWFGLFPPESFVVLGYGGVAESFSLEELTEDRSSKDVWDLLTSLERGETKEAVEYLKALNERWGKDLLSYDG